VARLRGSHSYRFLLLLTLAIFVFIMAVPDGAWSLGLTALLLCGTLIVAIWTAGFGWSLTRTLTVGAAGVVAAVVAKTVSSNVAAGAVWFVALALAAATIWVIALGVVDQGEVNSQSVVGAICIYLQLGLLFSFAYGSAAKLESGFFFAQGTDGTAAIRLYFSYITMATVGYGDYSPAGNLGRTLAVLEGILGQLYLVTVVALLISRIGRRQEDRG
jgi:voltage-gated potassium channel